MFGSQSVQVKDTRDKCHWSHRETALITYEEAHTYTHASITTWVWKWLCLTFPRLLCERSQQLKWRWQGTWVTCREMLCASWRQTEISPVVLSQFYRSAISREWAETKRWSCVVWAGACENLPRGLSECSDLQIEETANQWRVCVRVRPLAMFLTEVGLQFTFYRPVLWLMHVYVPQDSCVSELSTSLFHWTQCVFSTQLCRFVLFQAKFTVAHKQGNLMANITGVGLETFAQIQLFTKRCERSLCEPTSFICLRLAAGMLTSGCAQHQFFFFFWNTKGSILSIEQRYQYFALDICFLNTSRKRKQGISLACIGLKSDLGSWGAARAILILAFKNS